jgi:hypothetical protein
MVGTSAISICCYCSGGSVVLLRLIGAETQLLCTVNDVGG